MIRIPLTVWGWREMALATLVTGVPGALAWVGTLQGRLWCLPIAVVLTLIWGWAISFFRDPHRVVPNDPDALVAPADGLVTEISRIDHDSLIGGPAMRIGIFLSVFNVHINRSPCKGVVRMIRHEPGAFLDARHPESGSRNEANTIVIETDDPAAPTLVVRQIAGLLARRIVCDLKVGQQIERGQRIGMIKFGSRTELIVPGHDLFSPQVALGDKARGAATILALRCTGTASSEPQAVRQPAGRAEERT